MTKLLTDAALRGAEYQPCWAGPRGGDALVLHRHGEEVVTSLCEMSR